jgi:serine/threonine-protein kinase
VGDTLSDLLPVLTSDLVDAEALDYLWGVALGGGVARIPLLAPPIDATDHALEVLAAGSDEPLLLIARPVGLPDDEGFPLQLRPAPSSVARARRRNREPKTEPNLRPKKKTVPTLSKEHSRDLMGGEAVDRSTTPAALIGRSISGGKLVIEELVGAGGIGAVYKARHSGLNMPVAVKVLHESVQRDVEFCKRFHSEALAASQLDHPNLTRLYDFGQEPDGLLYIAMEFLQGKSLRSILETDGRLGAERSVKLMMQVCAGLLHVHARSLVHRDIKPDNLLVLVGMDDDGDPTELVKVCDFGIAVGGNQSNARLAGTPDYMSPEQCMGHPLDARSDVYACGIVLYELAVGRTPFEMDDTAAIMRAHVYDEPVAPSKRVQGVDPLLEAVILKSIAKDPAHRPQSARELRKELRAVLDAPRRAQPAVATDALAPAQGQASGSMSAAPSSGSMSAAPSSGSMSAAPKSASTSLPAFKIPDDGRDFATTLARDPTEFLQRLAAASGERRFSEVVASLDAAVPKLIERGAVATIWTLVNALEAIARQAGPRAAIATLHLKPFADPQTIAPVADLALGGTDEASAIAGRLLVRAGVGGAYALFTARVKKQDPQARKRFRALIQAIGATALPVLRSALERIASSFDARGAVNIAHDVLVSLPPVEDEALGNIVSRYARATDPGLAAVATAALPRLWGQRAGPLLVALLQHPGEPARAAAVTALHVLGGVDEHVARKLSALAADPKLSSPDIRAAVELALRRG